MEIITRYKDTLRKFVVIKEYPYFYLAQNELGYKECFSKGDVDGRPRKIIYNYEKLYAVGNEVLTINQIKEKYNLTRSQVIYRIQKGTKLKDGNIIKEYTMS